MSQEITCSSARLHLLSPVHTAVFRGKEAVCWLRSKGHKELTSLGKGNGQTLNSRSTIASTRDIKDGTQPQNSVEDSLDILNWMLRENLVFHVAGGGGLLKIPNPMHQIKSAGRKTPAKRSSSSSPSISSPMSKNVSSPSSYSQINTSVNKLQFIDSSKALYRFNDALIADRHVHVIVHYAESLIGKSKDGTSSPFVRLELGRQRAETKVVSKNLNAKWEEHFIFGMVEREELTSSLRISVWDSHVGRSAFLGQASVYIRSNGEIRVPFIQETDERGYAKEGSCPSPTRLKLQKRSIKSRVGGYIYVTTYVTDFNFSPYLRIRAFSRKNFFESDPVFMKHAMRETFGCVLSREEMGQQVAMAASSASGYWDLKIRLKSFQEVQLKGEVRDLKIASALLLPGMQWKNRVVAKIRWGKHKQVELESPWILRKNGRWRSNNNTMCLSHLLHEDIRQGQIEIDLLMRDTWAAEWDKNARILGTTAAFTLEELPRVIGKAEDVLVNAQFDLGDDGENHGRHRGYSGAPSGGVQGDLLQDFPLFVRTHAGKKHRIRNGTLQAAVYLVPSNGMDNSFKDDLSLIQKDNEQSKRLSQPSTVTNGLKFPVLDIIVDTSFNTLKRYLFSDNTSFLVAFYASLSYRNINIGPWELTEDPTDLTQPAPKRSNKNGMVNMSRKISFLLPDGRAVSEIQSIEAQKCVVDEENIVVIEVKNISQELPFHGLYDAKWQIAIIFDRARFTRLRVTADLKWSNKISWPKKTQQAVESGFVGGCNDKFDSLAKFLEWTSNQQWKQSSTERGKVQERRLCCSTLRALGFGEWGNNGDPIPAKYVGYVLVLVLSIYVAYLYH
eukprot:g16230.t1